MPLHERIWGIDIHPDGTLKEHSVDEALDFFTKYSAMVLCTALYINGHLWLNDSLSENGLQEYCVVKVDDVEAGFVIGHEIESVTINWAIRDLEALRAFMLAPEPYLHTPVRLSLSHGRRCELCA